MKQLTITRSLKNRALFHAVLAASALSFGAYAQSGNIQTIEGYASGTAGLTINSGPVVTYILSAPGTVNSHTYTTWSFLVNDGSGSLDVYSTLSGLGYTPTVGDAVSLTGTWAPYQQLPEMGPITAISLVSSGHSVPAPAVTTITAALVGSPTAIPSNLSGYLVTINNVSLYTDSAATIPVSGNFGTGNTTLYMKDSGGNIMEVYDWVTSYSTDAAFIGTAEPTGAINITGFLHESSGYPTEITPMSWVAVPVPEPTSLWLLGGFSLLAWRAIRRRK